jgi:hypothetical protein
MNQFSVSVNSLCVENCKTKTVEPTGLPNFVANLMSSTVQMDGGGGGS